MNWEEACQEIGVPVTATSDEIRAQYLYKVQLLHPDKTVGLPDRARKQAEEELKTINAAYSVLKDPKNNTGGKPPKLKISPKNIRFSEVVAGQPKTTQITIESIGGPFTKFWMGDSPASWLRIVEVKSTTKDPLPLEVTLEATASGSSQKQWYCELPIRLENEKSQLKDESVVKLGMIESDQITAQNQTTFVSAAPTQTSDSPLTFGRNKKWLFLLIPPVLGLVIFAFVRSLIPFWILLGSALLFFADHWFNRPIRKDRRVGMIYRTILNLSILFYFGFLIWCVIRLFSRQYMPTPLIGSLVFVGQIVFLVWLGSLVSKNSWRRPSMKLTFTALVAAFLIFAYAGVEPMATYKDNALSNISTFFTPRQNK
jgi:hypothetical protein